MNYSIFIDQNIEIREAILMNKIEPHLRFTSKFKLKKLSVEQCTNAKKYAESKNYIFNEENQSHANTFHLNDYVAQFPVIITENGSIWELSNQYFILYMLSSSEITGSTLKSLALDLLDYYRFVTNNNLSFFHFPKLNRERVTYQYKNYLILQVQERKCKKITASRRINTVVDFYERLIDGNYLNNNNFENEAFERIFYRITLNNNIGLEFSKLIKSSNLAIRVPKKIKEYDCINDGGVLRPLTLEQQKIVIEYLKKYSNIQMYLMCMFALTTGARMQTIATLKKYHLNEIFEKNRKNPSLETTLKVGGSSGIDTKYDKNLLLHIPHKLINKLEIYINSNMWKNRARKSSYGETEKAYVFSTRQGLPYYTSKEELLDIKNDKNASQSSIRRGEAIRKNLDDIISKIQIDYPNFPHFSFHDFRASFGMNYLRLMLNHKKNKDECLIRLKDRMGHSNINTTLAYLNHVEILEQFTTIQDHLEEILFGDIFYDK